MKEDKDYLHFLEEQKGFFEGEVIDTVVLPSPDFFGRNKAATHFVVLLDDNTFEQWPIEECTKVK